MLASRRQAAYAEAFLWVFSPNCSLEIDKSGISARKCSQVPLVAGMMAEVSDACVTAQGWCPEAAGMGLAGGVCDVSDGGVLADD